MIQFLGTERLRNSKRRNQHQVETNIKKLAPHVNLWVEIGEKTVGEWTWLHVGYESSGGPQGFCCFVC